MRVSPDLAPTWWSSSSGMPSNIPPTRPSLARNSSITFALKSAGEVDIALLGDSKMGTGVSSRADARMTRAQLSHARPAVYARVGARIESPHGPLHVQR